MTQINIYTIYFIQNILSIPPIELFLEHLPLTTSTQYVGWTIVIKFSVELILSLKYANDTMSFKRFSKKNDYFLLANNNN
jgi:hypothetical protein